jgi:hypothetical protein
MDFEAQPPAVLQETEMRPPVAPPTPHTGKLSANVYSFSLVSAVIRLMLGIRNGININQPLVQ